MTMPDERTRALRFAGGILNDLVVRDDVPAGLKHQARVTLRRYPDARTLSWMARDLSSPDGPAQQWLQPESTS